MVTRALFILITFTVSLFSETYQVELQKNVWNLIGVNGYHVPSKNAIPMAGWTQIRDTADVDKNTTWDMIDVSTQNTTATPDIGDIVYSTLGIKIEEDSNPDLTSVIINYDKKAKDINKTFFTMFVSSEGNGEKADIKISFQEDYLGEKFYLTFNSSTTQSFEGEFNNLNTREMPLFMTKYKSNTTDAIRDITQTIDMNIGDNNISNLSNLDVNIPDLNYGETGGRQPLTPDDNLSVYMWDGNAIGSGWGVYSSNNPTIYNDFEEFEAGKSYWVKLDSSFSDPMGLLLGTGDINATTYSDELSLNDGWNLLSFDDSYIRYISSAVFVPTSEYTGSGMVIRDHYKHNKVIVPTNVSYHDINVSAYINNSVAVGDANGSFSWYLRSYPAQDNSGNSGVIIISDEPFEINASASTLSVAGQDLIDENYIDSEITGVADKQRMYQTRIDEFMLALEVNKELFNDSGSSLVSEKSASFSFNIPTVSYANFSVDLSSDTNISDAMNSISTELGSNGKVYMLDKNLTNEFDYLLISSPEKFYVRDTTVVGVYDYNGTAGAANYKLGYSYASTTDLVSDPSIDTTVSNIHSVKGTTGIASFVVNNNENRFMLMSGEHKKFSFKELGAYEQFTKINLNREDNESIKGAFTNIVFGTDLARTKIEELNSSETGNNWGIDWQDIANGTLKTGVPRDPIVVKKDLGYTPVWAQDFPTDGPLYKLKDLDGSAKRVNYILSGVTRGDSTIYWRQADVTMDPEMWKSEKQRFNLFKIHKDRGYWVYLDSTNVEANPLDLTEPTFARTITRSFNNLFGNDSSNEVSTVDNRQSILTEVSITGLEFGNIGAVDGEKAENINMVVDGEVIPMIKDGISYDYIVNVSDYEYSALRERVKPTLNTGLLFVVSDGKGNRKEKKVIFDNQKPIAPEYSFEDNTTDSGNGYFGGLRFVFDDNVMLRIYDGNLSDHSSNDSKLIKEAEDVVIPDGVSEVIYHVNPLAGTYISFGTAAKPYYDLRLIISTDNDLWSDMRRVFYAPVYKQSHIIEADESNTTGNNPDYLPVAFDSIGQNPVNYTEGGLQTNSGIELLAEDGNITDDNVTLSMSYKPIMGAKFDSGVPNTIYFDDNSSNGYVGRLQYSTLYEGEVFYIYSDDTNTTYYQIFPTAAAAATYTTVNPLELIPIDSNQSFYKPSL